MQPLTRDRYSRFCANVAEIYGADPALVGKPGAEWFNIQGATSADHYAAGATPSPQQRLVERMQQSADFLSRINMIGVEQQTGQTIGLDVTNPVASRANATTNPPTRRLPIDPTGLDNFPYSCVPTEFNPLFKYSKLDAWAKFPDFEIKMRDAILKRQALDRIQIGWNGTSVATSFDPTVDPTLSGMNIGWLQWMLTNQPERVLSSGAVANTVSVSATGDYVSLDALVYDARMTLLPSWVREDDDLVCIAGSDIIHDKYFPIVNRNETSLDMIAQAALFMGSKTIGFIPAYRVPYMPAGTLMITKFSNLSIYYQTGAMRRMLRDEPHYNRVVDYQSSNEAYVIEDPAMCCVVKNITVPASVNSVAQTQANTDHDDGILTA